MAAAEGAELWGGAPGVAVVGGVGAEVALNVQLVVKYYGSNIVRHT